MEKSNNTNQTVYLFVFDGFSDWEPAYAMAEINRSGKFKVRTFATTALPVQSAGGLMVLPSVTTDDECLQHAAMLVIPGGKALEQKKYREVLPVIEYAYNNGIPIAAICSATALLADMGILDDIRHTSNTLFYLKQQSGWYTGNEFYVDENAVTGNNIITAGGIYPVEFAREIFKLLQVYDDETIEKWYLLFSNGIWVT
jgi:putative intracellular protease/amidase